MNNDLLRDLRVDREHRLRRRIDELLKLHHQDTEHMRRLERTIRRLNNRLELLELRLDLWQRRLEATGVRVGKARSRKIDA